MGLISSPTNRNMLHLWKFFTVILVLQACLIYSNDAKQTKEDLTFDDTFDIDRYEEDAAASAATNAKSRTSRDLDVADLLEDELQPADEDENIENDESGWFFKGVRRVRRELGRIFGGSNEKIKPAKQHKKRNLHNEKKGLKTKKEHLTNKLNKHSKRAENGDPYDPLEGSGRGEHLVEHMKYYETHFLIHEPWMEEYRHGRVNEQFVKLEAELSRHLRELFLSMAPDDADIDSETRITLDGVEPSSDSFKIYVTCTLYLTEQSETAYRNLLYTNLLNYHRIGDMGAEIDDKFYLRQYRGRNTETEAEAETTEAAFVDACLADPDGWFTCRNGQYIECEKRCNNLFDCEDESDEEEALCRVLWRDDETSEATISQPETEPAPEPEPEPEPEPDNEIPEGITEPAPEPVQDYCAERPELGFVCGSGERISCSSRCDGLRHCADGSDESPALCSGENEQDRREEDEEHREENRDEDREEHRENNYHAEEEGSGDADFATTTEASQPAYLPSCRNAEYYTCPYSNYMICAENRCDNHEDCPDGEDEADCGGNEEYGGGDIEKVCAEYEFKCDDRCLPKEYRCNGNYECIDRTDEDDCPTQKECQPHEFKCRSGDCIDSRLRCDRVQHCPDGDDEDESCPATRKRPSDCAADEFFCDDDCHPNYIRCNGYADCTDGSDEHNCYNERPTRRPPPTYPCPQHTCPNGKCYSENERCDRVNDCDDGADEQNCSYNEQTNTPAGQLNLKTYPDSQIIKERREVIFRCRDEGPLRARVRWTRPGGRPLPIGSVDKNGRLEIPNIRVEDSGQYICEAVGYPRHVPGQQVTVHLTVERFNPLLDRPPTACHQSQATCMNGECIDKSQICDGTPHCSDGSDEHSCSHGRKCHPNQFMCRNSKCVDRIWRCDGENDCGDNSDEESCEPEPSGAPCRYDEFQCKTGHCIPKSFQCDDTNDCIDASDEIGCAAPTPIRPLPPSMNLRRGESLNLTCVGTGIPVPVIVWRLNWGHVPEKCVSKSYSGTGTLYCADMQQADSGAYSCEIINSKGSHFVTPDTLVTVDTPIYGDVCPAGFFNMLARSREDCISCFCFGVSKNCKSANLFNFALQPPINSNRVLNVELNPYGAPTITEAPSPNIINLHHGVQFRASDVQYNSREMPYLALPEDYLGNQLKSYGGFLRYEVNYVGNGRPVQTPDVIITGNGMVLVHRSPQGPQPSIRNKMSVQLTPGNWNKPDGRSATREEIMMVLANVEHVLLRLSYIDSTEREVEIINLVMDSAGLQDQGLGAASLIEQCQCPVGYIGDSCETCAPGYVRQPGGPWLGRCVPFVPEPCAPGTYGDPRRGIPCRECPCPQSGSNNFASGCKLGPDGEVTCDCYEGYSGRRCEHCAPGFDGNPLVPGGSCHRVHESVCNSEGTYYPHPNGTCECKPLVVGPRCDMCAPESFNLNSYTYTGCTECFCSGLTKQCSSSSWYRDQISSSFGRSRAPHGFTLIRDYERPQPSGLNFDETGDSLQFSPSSNSEPLYWNLPAQFLGDKITAYGGKLNYTLSYNPLPGGLMSRNNAPDVVIKSGEEYTIIHQRKAGVNPSQSSSYSVPIIESAWQRSDGQVVNREHLLMALSKIDAIYIKATYTTSTKSAALMHVSLDIATQNNIGTPRAVEVEECRCPVGYIGLSCERCSPGYKRDTEAGLYLGICEPCECNGHSSQCDAETGVCMNCADNTEGENCERCIAGYVGNPSAGTPYDCQPDNGGYPDYPTPSPSPDNQERCRSCSQAGTTSCEEGVCHCKPNVVGIRCDQCRPGTYGLHSDNHDGCSECYCSGKSTQCHSASLYRQLIPIDFIKDPPQLTDEDGIIADTENLNHDLSTNQYIYSYTSYTQKYWSLRGSVLGNQLHSYGGDLTYNLQVESYGEHVPGPDVILIGNGLKLTWSRPRSEDQRAPDYHIRLHEENNWYRIENGRASSATRLDLMQVLSNLDHILLRATPLIPTTRTSLRDVILESAVEHPMPGAQQALEVELCSCPPEYTGNSCESCAPLHYRDSYGNCAVCPCQEDSTSSCALGEAGYVVCNCKPGHKGDRCQIFDDESPYVPTTTPIPDYRTQITVSITPPKITIIPVGGSITLTCTGHLAWNNDPVLVSWYKKNDEMPIDFTEDDGILHMYNLQIYDSGVYICKAVSNQTGKSFEDEVSITITEGGQRTPAKIENLPNYHTFTENVANQIVCDVSGNPAPTVTWTRVDGQMSHDVTTDNNRLIFHAPRQSDHGHYRCQATNSLGTDEKYTQINVELGEREPQPQPNDLVYIEPSSYNGVRSDNVRLTCHQTGTLSLVYQWTKDGYPIYPQSNVQISNNVIDIRDARGPDSGTYICTGVDPRGRRNFTSSAVVRILESGRPQPPPEPTSHPGTVPPTVKRLPEEHRIIQGHDFSLTCEASGTPYPNIKWTKVHESLADNVHPQGNVLRIINARPENRGMYLCIAENSAGSDQSHTVIDVEPRERPTVDIHPPEPQTVYAGQEARLYCNGNGIPEPRLQWRRVDGKPLPIQLKEESPGYITIDNIKLEDAGDYECAAENDIGKATAVSTIRVIEAPSITLIPNEEILRVTEGDELKIICSATGSPSPSVKWENDESETRVMSVSAPIPSYNQAFLEIYRVDRSHSKTYKCIASNEAGTDERYVTVDVQPRRGDAPDDSDVDRQPYPTYPSQPQQQQEIVYIEPPQFTGRPGDSVRLICNQRSSVPMTFQWTKDGYPIYREVNIRVEGNVVDIEYAKAEDSGTYTCSGFDPYSRRNYTSSSVVTFVDDNYPQPQPQPQPNQQPHRPNNPPQNIYRANAGDAVTLTCDLLSTETPAERIPYLTTRWERVDGRPLPHNSRFDRNSLIITGVEEENSGKYRCNAMDSRGTVVTFIIAELVLMPIPHITFHPKMPIVVIANENVDIYCEVTGEQPIDVSWHTDNNRPLPPSVHIDGQYLRFVSITPADAGRYYCSASNRYGNTTNMAEVVVNRGNSYEQPHTRRHDINEGEDVTLTCDVQDAREPIRGEIRYEWHREDGRPLPYSAYINNQILFLRAVRKEDEGRYVCESYTTAGYRSSPSYVDLNIKREYPRNYARRRRNHNNRRQ